jgi:hypothetical protein
MTGRNYSIGVVGFCQKHSTIPKKEAKSGFCGFRGETGLFLGVFRLDSGRELVRFRGELRMSPAIDARRGVLHPAVFAFRFSKFLQGGAEAKNTSDSDKGSRAKLSLGRGALHKSAISQICHPEPFGKFRTGSAKDRGFFSSLLQSG